MKLCLVGGAEQPNAAQFAWTERRAPEPDQMSRFGELSGAHTLRRAQLINFGGASSFGNRGDQIDKVFHALFMLNLIFLDCEDARKQSQNEEKSK